VHVGVQLLESVDWNWYVQPVESKLPSKAQISSLSGWIVTIPRSTLPDVQCAVIGSPNKEPVESFIMACTVVELS
jgi:hypothetical protein